jgi:hypothetical protein
VGSAAERGSSLPPRTWRPRARTANLQTATQFEIPHGPCLFYLFNPFQEEIVTRFLDRVHESYIRNPRPIRFVYLHPVHQYVFEGRHELKRVTPDPL